MVNNLTPLAPIGPIERGTSGGSSVAETKDTKDTTVVHMDGNEPSQLDRDFRHLDDRRYRDAQSLILGR